jgi:hypothetical protein
MRVLTRINGDVTSFGGRSIRVMDKVRILAERRSSYQTTAHGPHGYALGEKPRRCDVPEIMKANIVQTDGLAHPYQLLRDIVRHPRPIALRLR